MSRFLLNARFAAVLAVVLVVFATGIVAGAAGQPLIIGAANQAGTANTSLDTTSAGFAWQMYQHGSGVGVFAISETGVALAGLAHDGNQQALSVTNDGAAGTGSALIADGKNNTAADLRVNSNSIPPLKVNSTGLVSNLNADRVDGLHAADMTRVALMSTAATTAIPTDGSYVTYGGPLTIVAPAAGFVLVTSSVTVQNLGCNTNCVSWDVIRHIENGSTSNFAEEEIVNLFSAHSVTWVFPVVAGTHTFDLRLARNSAGNGVVNGWWGMMTAHYSPFGSTGLGTLGTKIPANTSITKK